MNNFQLISQVFQHHFWQALLAAGLVFIPIIIWIFIFAQEKRREKGVLFLTFLAGIGSALIMFLYQYFWETQLDFGFFELTPVNFQSNIGAWTTNVLLSVFLIALSIGLIEEYLKHWVVKKADHAFFRSVDDVIRLSIVAALGFAFTENILYVFRELLHGGFSSQFFSLFFLRSLFVVFVHVLCSGIYGYYYGIGYYARPILEEDEHEGRKKWIPSILHRFVHLKKPRVFHDEMVVLGLLVAMSIHGLFDFFMSVDWTLGDILHIEALNQVGIHIVILPLYLLGGLLYLTHLLNKKQDHEKFGRVQIEPVYTEYDLEKNVESLQELEKAMEENYQHRGQVKEEATREGPSLEELMSEDGEGKEVF